MDERRKELLISLFSDAELMARFKKDPKGVLREKGFDVPDDVEIRVVEDTEKVKHIVIPYLGVDVPSAEAIEERATKYWIIA